MKYLSAEEALKQVKKGIISLSIQLQQPRKNWYKHLLTDIQT